MEYEVHCVLGTWLDRDNDEQQPTEPVDIIRPIEAVYEAAALHGGRIVAGHTMHVSGQECLFLVEERPDSVHRRSRVEPIPPQTA
jgi:hypothetical protein